MLQNNLLFISIQLLLNFVLIQKETSYFELQILSQGQGVQVSVD